MTTMPMGWGNPGSKYVDPRRKLAERLLAQGINTGPANSHTEGLARLASALMGGYMQGKSSRDETEANKALMRGLTAEQWKPPAGEQVYADGQGPVRMVDGKAMLANGQPAMPSTAPAPPAGGFEGARYALGQMPDNPYAANAGAGLAMQQYAYQQALAAEQRKAQQAKDMAVWERDNMPQNVAPGNTVLQGGKPIYEAPFKPERLIPGRDVPYDPRVAAQLTNIAAARVQAGMPQFAPSGTGVQTDARTGEQKPAPLTPEQKIEAKRAEAQPKAFGALQALERQTNTVVSHIDKALDLIGPWSTGYGAMLSGMPESDAGKLENELTTIKANLGFDKLQDMRANSPTGGALGAVSEMENKLLQAVNGALDPKQSEQLEANLKAIKALYPAVLEDRRRAYQADYGQAAPQGGGQPTPGGVKFLGFE